MILLKNLEQMLLEFTEMFMGPFDQTAPWSMESIRGCAKFLDRVWNLQTILVDGNEYSAKFEKMMHRAIKKFLMILKI